MSEKPRGYAHRVDIAADAEKVWLALTKVEYLTRWCSPRADIKARKGGLFRASVDRVIELEAHIDVYEPARRLRLIYLPSPELPPADTAIIDDFILDATPPETIVRLFRLRHSKQPGLGCTIQAPAHGVAGGDDPAEGFRREADDRGREHRHRVGPARRTPGPR